MQWSFVLSLYLYRSCTRTTIQYTYLQIIVSSLDYDIHSNIYIYVNEFHKNESTMRILASILTDLVFFCTRLVGFGTQVQVALLGHCFQDSQMRGILWERMISDVCLFWHMFLWRLSDILNDFKDMRRICPP